MTNRRTAAATRKKLLEQRARFAADANGALQQILRIERQNVVLLQQIAMARDKSRELGDSLVRAWLDVYGDQIVTAQAARALKG